MRADSLAQRVDEDLGASGKGGFASLGSMRTRGST
jgi:hypothetical protein